MSVAVFALALLASGGGEAKTKVFESFSTPEAESSSGREGNQKPLVFESFSAPVAESSSEREGNQKTLVFESSSAREGLPFFFPSSVAEREAPKLWLVAQAKTEPDLSGKQLPARAAPKTIAVLLLSGEEVGFALSDIYANARSVIEANTALNVAPLDVISTDERAQAIRACAGRGACFADRVRQSASASNVGLLLTVSADRLDEGYLLGFRLVDVETSKDIGAAGDEVPSDMSLLGAMEQQLPGVFPKEIWGQIATVAIDSEPPNAEVSVGARSCVSPCELSRMAPGDYDVTVRKAGYIPWSGKVTLVAREQAKVSAQLTEPEGGVASTWWFWTLVGVVVVGGATAAVVATRPSSRVVTICIASDPAQCDQ